VAMAASLARLGVAWAWHAAGTHINLYVTDVPAPPVPPTAHEPDGSAPGAARGQREPIALRRSRIGRAPACESAGARRRR